MSNMKIFDLKNGWKIMMYEKNEVFFNENTVAVIDYYNEMTAKIQFEEDKIDFLHSTYNMKPKLLLNEKIIVLPYTPGVEDEADDE